jgi:hypothetical protein
MINSAKYYLQTGVSVIPTSLIKSPHHTIKSWTKYQFEQMAEDEVSHLFYGAAGIATIGGMVSGGRVHIDFDTKYDLTGTLYEDYCNQINDIDPTILKRMVIVRTPSGGYHWIYNTDAPIIPSMKLAQRETTNDERDHKPNELIKVLIETKGDKGYCLAPPTKGYLFISELKSPIHISKSEEEVILEVARSFDKVPHQIIKEPKNTSILNTNDYIESPFEAYNKSGNVNAVLVQHGWQAVYQKGSKTFYKRPGDSKTKTSGNYDSEKRWFSVFSTSTQFEINKAYNPVSVFCLLTHNNDWSKCAKDLIEQGFGKNKKPVGAKYAKEISRLKSKDTDRDDIITRLREVGNVSIDEAIEIIDSYESNQGTAISQFWEVKHGKDDNKRITILLNKFIRFINEKFYIYRYKVVNKQGDGSDGLFRYVMITNNVIKEVRMTDIKDLITDYVNGLEFVFDGIYRDQLMEVVQQKSATLFTDSQMEFLSYANVEILKDTVDTAYYPFLNVIVFVNRNGVHTMSYQELNGRVIWKDRIIQHNYTYNGDVQNFSFNRFISKINNDNQIRIEYFASCIGYILHGYKDELNPICLVLGEEVADSSQGGGAGKGLITQALGKIINQVIIDGKGFNASKPFAFQRVGLDTQLIIIQDTDKSFDFESLYSKLTDGLTIEKKNKDEIFLSYSDSPKFLITTNYSIPNTSSASKRRQRLIEFSNFFNDTHTPFDYLGEYLFFGWNADDWNRFYTMMFEYVSFYFQNGLKKFCETDTSIEKRIKTNFTDDFYDFFMELPRDTHLDANHYYHNFLSVNDLLDKNYSKNRFARAMKDSASFLKLELIKKRDSITRHISYIISTTGGVDNIEDKEEIDILPF